MRIEYIRDGLVEEVHEGIFLKLDEGNIYPALYYLRSCAKPLQAALLEDYDADLTEEELALCCGSHAGEECHIRVAREILKKYNIDEKLLKCGIHPPLSRSMQDGMLLRGEEPTPIHNNCSGKHIGFLILCKINGWDMESYNELAHPLQQAVIKKIYQMCGINISPPYLKSNKNIRELNSVSPAHSSLNITTDGCGVPIVSMPLYNMLVGYINLLKYDKIIRAISDYPYIYGGENRLDTEIIEKTDGIIAKVGAGGLCIVVNTRKKDAFAVKINDCSMEARRYAVLEMINRLGWGNIKYDNNIKTIQGKIVGKIVVT